MGTSKETVNIQGACRLQYGVSDGVRVLLDHLDVDSALSLGTEILKHVPENRECHHPLVVRVGETVDHVPAEAPQSMRILGMRLGKETVQ